MLDTIRDKVQELILRYVREQSLFDKRIDNEPSELMKSIGNYILYCKFSIKHYLLTDETQFSDLWDHLRGQRLSDGDEPRLDLAMAVLAEIKYCVAGVSADLTTYEKNWNYLISFVARSNSFIPVTGTNASLCQVDSDLTNRAINADALEKLIAKNEWYLGIFFLGQTPITKEIRGYAGRHDADNPG